MKRSQVATHLEQIRSLDLDDATEGVSQALDYGDLMRDPESGVDTNFANGWLACAIALTRFMTERVKYPLNDPEIREVRIKLPLRED